ncbi:MAG TPA: serine dehydratase subunit alpha family protein [Planctomycetaceae bacterium]|nr:serine dehydratase subunit alpha family protein [Planctomycetaceae bacterium]
MNLLKEVLSQEVYPALGCTEPIACAFASATAAAHLGKPVEQLLLRVDPGTYKNGATVVVPHSGGATGNLIAAALGAVLGRPDARLELLRDVTPAMCVTAAALCRDGKARCECIEDAADFRVEAEVAGGEHRARCILAGGHTNVVLLERDGSALIEEQTAASGSESGSLPYRAFLRAVTLHELLATVPDADEADRRYIEQGIDMNLAMAQCGEEMSGTAGQLRRMHERGYLAADLFYRTKLLVASAVDARMAGVDRPVMTSGGSGNQGIVAILTPYQIGIELGVERGRIVESIAVAHLVNAYVKCFLGELSVICGCAMAAGIAAAVAIVHQQAGNDAEKTTLAVNNVVGDLGGLICDGAKPGCAMKTITAVDTAIRSGLMALEGFGLNVDDGMVGNTAEDTIRNLSQVTLEGMFSVDPAVLRILQQKNPHNHGPGK